MKYYFHILLTFIYLVLCTGVNTYAHFCGNKLSSVSVFIDHASCCCEGNVKIGEDLDYMESNSKQEDERKNRNLSFTSTSVSSILAKFGYYATILMAYAIILLFIYASFTI